MMRKRLWVFVLATGTLAGPAQAQLPPPTAEPASNTLRFYYARVKGLLIAAAEKMPEEHYAFRPTPEVRNFGSMVAHAANANYFLCASARKEPSPVGQAELEKTKTTKAEIVAALKSAFAYCDPVFAGLQDAQLGEPVRLFGLDTMKAVALQQSIAHMWEHYGNMVTYLRMKGLVPPSTQQAPAARPASPPKPL